MIVEVHPDPASALSDGVQSLTFEAFATMMRVLAPLAEACGRQLDIPLGIPLGAHDAALLVESGTHSALRVCA